MSKASTAPALFLTDAALRRGFDLLLVSYRHYRDGIDDTLRAAGLGQAHHRAIYFIHRHDGVSPMELRELLSITKQSLRRVILDLLEGGFIEARPSKVDRRRKHYSLTPKGPSLAMTSCTISTTGSCQRLTVSVMHGVLAPARSCINMRLVLVRLRFLTWLYPIRMLRRSLLWTEPWQRLLWIGARGWMQ